MPEVAIAEPVTTTATTTTSTDTTSLGWRAGLPDDLKQNTDLATFKTVGDFAKSAIETKAKVTDLEKKLGDSIPKLPDDATVEERATYLDALGRPKTAADYKLDGEDKNDPKAMSEWKADFHELGLTQAQANGITQKYGARINKLVDDFKAKAQQEISASEQQLKTKWGTKFDTNVELAKRLWKNYGKAEFDNAFSTTTDVNRFVIMDMIVDFASKTGEDTSPQAGHSGITNSKTSKEAWMTMYQNPVKGK